MCDEVLRHHKLKVSEIAYERGTHYICRLLLLFFFVVFVVVCCCLLLFVVDYDAVFVLTAIEERHCNI